ncbi:MAG: IS110 family transposase [Acidobacteria bacterium]|nr:IS110 family transposase [Acidobacteriota bacterium]
MKHLGLDVHTNWTVLAWVDAESGEIADPYRLDNTELLAHLAELLADGGRVALETGSRSIFLARQLKSLELDVLVVDAARLQPYLAARRTAKTDRNDALSMAQLLASGELDALAVYVPDEYTEELRNLTRTRLHFSGQATATSNTLRSLVRSQGRDFPGVLSTKRTQRWLDEWEPTLSEHNRLAVQELRQAWAEAQARLKRLDAALKAIARRDARVARLMTLPGVAELTAVTLVAEIGDIARFPAAKHLRSYARLVPQISQSGERTHTGPLVKRGNRHLSRALILMAQHVSWRQDLYGTTLKRRYRRCRDRHGANPAKVALARDLCDIVFAMLREGTEFDASRLPRVGARAA